MTKSDLINQVAQSANQSKKDVEQMVDAVFDGIVAALKTGERLDIRGFGAFKVRDQAARQGRNPRTGEAITIEARRVASFKPSKQLSEQINA
jgi:integration host factor beta subunit